MLHKPRFFWHYLILCRRDCRVRSSCIISARNDITSYYLTVRTLGYRIGKLLLITINYYKILYINYDLSIESFPIIIIIITIIIIIFIHL